MKGIIFTLLENRIHEDHGDEVWDEILTEADLDGVYTTLGTYPYEELLALLEAAAEYTGYRGRQAQQWFGRQALHQLAGKYPELFDPHDSSRSFALTINDVIHPEVRKLYPGAHVPTFALDEHPDGGTFACATGPTGGCARSPRVSWSAPRTTTVNASRSTSPPACTRAIPTAISCSTSKPHPAGRDRPVAEDTRRRGVPRWV